MMSSGLLARIGALVRPVRELPPAFVESAGARDDDEMLSPAVVEIDESIEGLVIGISYVDARGEASDRVIECYHLVGTDSGDVLLRAYCHVRAAPRCFRLDRIRQITDYRTGEIHDDPKPVLASFCAAAGIAWSGRSAGEDHARLIRTLRDPLKVLLFVAGCDGDLDPREGDHILLFADDMAWTTDGRRLDYDEDALIDWLERQRPTWEQVEKSLGRVVGWDERSMRRFLLALRSVIEADEVLDSAEVDLLADIVEVLNSAGPWQLRVERDQD